MMNIKKKKKILEAMVRLYCKKQHNAKTLCNDCADTLQYSDERLTNCPYGDQKPACKNCSTHCYKPEQREKIREVMRFSGPRMMLHHPIMAIQHMLDKNSASSPLKKND